MTDLIIREAEPPDQRFLSEMFVEAVLWRPQWPRVALQALLEQPELARYFSEWGRPGDIAMVAAIGNEPAGAVWARTFTESEPGYGFVGNDIPELGLAVSANWRRHGVGSALVRELQAWARTRGIAGLSLSVHRENPARQIDQRTGFVEIGSTETAVTMFWRVSFDASF